MSELAPNYSASWSFLQQFHPGRLIVVTGISLDKQKIPTETFGPNDREKFLKWVESCGKSQMNLYFSVGEPMQAVTKKMERTDIRAVHYLHVDLDPRAGEDLAQERARIEALLRAPTGGLPPPTGIVFSGGGYQGYWKLKAPLQVDGVFDTAEDLKLYNVQIERLLGGDNCHNIDRIMRIPGSINLPDARKQKKGRTPQLAEVIEWHDDRVYDISQFTKAVQVQGQTNANPAVAGVGPKPKIAAPSNIKRLNDVNDLGPGVSNSVKVYIVQGCNPDEPDHFPSRSEMLFWVTCELVRAGVDNDTIFSVLTDKDFRISDSVLEKGSGAERYALRQIERAQEQAVDPMLRELNDRHAVIENYGGRCVVIEEMTDPVLERTRLSAQGFDHFRNRYMNRSVQVGMKQTKSGGSVPQEMPAGEWWLRHGQRRQFHKIVFAPGRDTPGDYNLWRGFGCEARPGDCGLFLDHLFNIVCGGVKEYYDYLIGWMANCVQNPSVQGHSSVVLRGRQGCGKSIVPALFGRIFGRHYLMVSKPEHLVGNFNAHLRDVVLLFADEAFFAGDKRNESALKTLVTERTLTIERKGVDAEVSANCVHLMMASNEKWVVPAGSDDRRYFVLDCLPDKIGNRAYFDALVKQMENGGDSALLHFLLTYDLKGFDIRSVPKTEALREQKALSMDPDAEWWLQILRRGTVLPEHDEWREYVSVDLLGVEYNNYTRNLSLSRKSNSTKLGIAMKEMLPKDSLKRLQRRSPVEVPQPDGTNKLIAKPWYYKMPSLEECRKHFDANFGGPYNWKADLPEEDVPDYGDDTPEESAF